MNGSYATQCNSWPPTDSRIVGASLYDIPELVQVEQQCYAQPWSSARFEQEYLNPVSHLLLSRGDTGIAAYLCFWHVDTEVEIHNIACAPLARRSGAAQRLLTYLRHWCGERGVEYMFLEVRHRNLAALNLYRKFGFSICGRRENYYSDGEDALLMQYLVGRNTAGDRP
ncbi:MAG: ribosomal protein S18-alanine N-acetyltransferase [Desulfuromonadaceae bacterium]|nr:ribosomal protein S18-alanine N-acetyltransferase [Desulfuromonas sp.]MDY0185204.1 ribosomal protein S18-alanine N-acetyltransferase [Desulfuromonadaceae bacterium]